jgi:crotonobetainyl-CoA:carnitine CoA-transferase CaiB-like acyl-CoA transferase
MTGEAPARYGNAHPNIVPYQTFPTRDGYLALAVGTDTQYKRLCLAMQRPDLWEDKRFQTNSGRVENRQVLIPMLQTALSQQSTLEWLELMREHKIPAGPINEIPTIFADPQLEAREMVQEIEHSTLGKIKQIGPVAKLSETPATLRLAPPFLGEHTDSILSNELGYSSAEITRLREEGVI